MKNPLVSFSNSSIFTKSISETKSLFLCALLLPILVLFALEAKTQTVTFSYTGNVQSFTVPQGAVDISIRAAGGSGGSSDFGGGAGGLGADVYGEFLVTPGQTYNIVVGQAGTGNTFGGGGGGGTFVYSGDIGNSGLLVAAGGGGGAGRDGGEGCDASISNDGTLLGLGCALGAMSGNPGACGPGDFGGGGGAGWLGSGQGLCGIGPGGGGGDQWEGGVVGSSGTLGGFGGGGGSSFAGGGGGGYSGGQGDVDFGFGAGSGGSFNSGLNQNNLLASSGGNGSVEITFLSPIPTLGQWGLIILSLLVLIMGAVAIVAKPSFLGLKKG